MSALFYRVVTGVLCTLLAGLGNALADPPARVGRVSYLSGTVLFYSDSTDDWVPATPNYPVTSNNSLLTEADARAEVQVGSTALRLDANTQLDVRTLDDHTLQLNVPQGSLYVHLRSVYKDDHYLLQFPHGSVSLLTSGNYRIDAGRTDDSTAVTVLSGAASVSTDRETIPLGIGKTAIVDASGSLAHEVREATSDAFSDWNLARDRRADVSRSARYVSPETTGYDDLDEYGDWRDVPDYGRVWIPYSTPPGWAPYRDGHWVWVAPWGWTWVDYAPWGFAPFHYGRWVFVDGFWGWWPGAFIARPVFAPALVAFIHRPGFSVSVAFGAVPAIGWFPLAPFELFVPGFRCSPIFVRSINVNQVVNINQINLTNLTINGVNFSNRKFPEAVTVVPQQTFARSRPVGPAVIRVTETTVAQVPVSGMTAPVIPTQGRIQVHPVSSGQQPAGAPPNAPLRRLVGVVPPAAASAKSGLPPLAAPAELTVRALAPTPASADATPATRASNKTSRVAPQPLRGSTPGPLATRRPLDPESGVRGAPATAHGLAPSGGPAPDFASSLEDPAPLRSRRRERTPGAPPQPPTLRGTARLERMLPQASVNAPRRQIELTQAVEMPRQSVQRFREWGPVIQHMPHAMSQPSAVHPQGEGRRFVVPGRERSSGTPPGHFVISR